MNEALAEVDEALRWATTSGTRDMAYLDKLLDARLSLADA